jgi:hypothetical protein
MPRIFLIAVLAAAVALAAATASRASSPPVGPLPAGPHATITTKKGELVAVALPHRSGGLVWRIARAYDGTKLRQVSEADVGANVVLVFKAVRAGNVKVVVALTKGERTKALAARTFEVRIGA